MHFNPSQTYHVYNKAGAGKSIFYSEANYEYFMQQMKTYLTPISEILAYCLMPGNFHLLVHTTEASCTTVQRSSGKNMQMLSAQLTKLIHDYARGVNKQEGRSGIVFQSKTKVIPLESIEDSTKYLIVLFQHIHHEPITQGLVEDRQEWPYSSFNEYALRSPESLCNRELFYELSGLEPTSIHEPQLLD